MIRLSIFTNPPFLLLIWNTAYFLASWFLIAKGLFDSFHLISASLAISTKYTGSGWKRGQSERILSKTNRFLGTKIIENKKKECISSRIRTGRSLTVCRSLLLGGGCLLPGGVCSGGICSGGGGVCSRGCLLLGGLCSQGGFCSHRGFCSGGVSALGGVCSQGGVCSGLCLLPGGVSAPRGVCLLPGVSAPRGCLLPWGVCSKGVSAPGDVFS